MSKDFNSTNQDKKEPNSNSFLADASPNFREDFYQDRLQPTQNKGKIDIVSNEKI